MYFTIETASGGYRARCYGANHELVWLTEVYRSKASAHQAINLIKSGAAHAQVIDRS